MSVRDEKREVVKQLAARMEEASSVILADYRGLTVAEVTELRRLLREAGVEFRVVKNTLMRRAANDAGFSDLESHLVGPTAAAFGADDPVAPARVLVKYARDNQHVELKVGVLEGRIIGFDEIRQLGELPSREQLLAQVAGVMVAPVRNMMYLLNAPVQNFVYGLSALRDQKA